MTWSTWRDYRHFADQKLGIAPGDEYDEFGGAPDGP